MAKSIQLSQLSPHYYSILWFVILITLLPHFFYQPWSLSILMSIVLLYWLILIHKHGHYIKAQSKRFQYSTVFLGLLFIFLHYRTFIGVEAGCAVLSLIFLGKAFEVKKYRDAVIEVNLALFVIASLFLYSQNMLLAMAALCAVFSCFYALSQLQNDHDAYIEEISQKISKRQLRRNTIKSVIKIFIFAIPFMLGLFLFFPRFPPLWNIPAANQQAQTGVSDQMSPGDIANLSQSSALAFRVIFSEKKQLPAKSQLYWRAMALEHFDGIRWTQSFSAKQGDSYRNVSLNYQFKDNLEPETIPYQIILEPTQQPWVFALDYSVASAPLQLKNDLSLQTPFPNNRRRQYDIFWLKSKPMVNIFLTEQSRHMNLQLPSQANPKTQIFAKNMFLQSNYQPEQYIKNILNWISTQQFHYTLSPPLLKGDRVDDFLFRTKAGFCEHYASSFVNLMRMVGIPARVVVGYQGGQWSPDTETWEIRQLDAHAWAEVWLKDQGWVRIDPTSVIAPERVELGMQSYSLENHNFYGNNYLLRMQNEWLTQIRIWSDYANYQWQNKVVGFDQSKQRQWLLKLSIHQLSQQIWILLAIISITFIIILWWLKRQQKVKLSALDNALQQLSQRLENKKLQRKYNEPILSWFERIQYQKDEETIKEIIMLYRQHVYIQALPKEQLKNLIKLLRNYSIN